MTWADCRALRRTLVKIGRSTPSSQRRVLPPIGSPEYTTTGELSCGTAAAYAPSTAAPVLQTIA